MPFRLIVIGGHKPPLQEAPSPPRKSSSAHAAPDEGNTSCTGNAQTSTSLIFAVTCRHGCENSRRTTGMRSFWLAPDWSVWAFYGRTRKSTLKVGNFFLKSFPTEFFYPQVVRA